VCVRPSALISVQWCEGREEELSDLVQHSVILFLSGRAPVILCHICPVVLWIRTR